LLAAGGTLARGRAFTLMLMPLIAALFRVYAGLLMGQKIISRRPWQIGLCVYYGRTRVLRRSLPLRGANASAGLSPAAMGGIASAVAAAVIFVPVVVFTTIPACVLPGTRLPLSIFGMPVAAALGPWRFGGVAARGVDAASARCTAARTGNGSAHARVGCCDGRLRCCSDAALHALRFRPGRGQGRGWGDMGMGRGRAALMEAELARSLEAFRAHPRGLFGCLRGRSIRAKAVFSRCFSEALKREMPSLNVGGLLSRGVFGESGKIAYEGRDLQNVAKDGEGAAIFMELFCGAAGGALGGAAGAAAANWLGVGNKSIPPFLLALKSELSAGESALIQSAFGISWEMTNTAPSVSMGQWRIFESGLACGRKAIERAVREKCDLVVCGRIWTARTFGRRIARGGG
jgi:hypothetical protein